MEICIFILAGFQLDPKVDATYAHCSFFTAVGRYNTQQVANILSLPPSKSNLSRKRRDPFRMSLLLYRCDEQKHTEVLKGCFDQEVHSARRHFKIKIIFPLGQPQTLTLVYSRTAFLLLGRSSFSSG